ncbi:MAG TPA: FG-GAP-like repeat-containing protein [candidate division Zixibacteria bacterium]|nr:FG-GAP-like repeat-containing protein [candidate division Zixibacteria bacterium]
MKKKILKINMSIFLITIILLISIENLSDIKGNYNLKNNLFFFGKENPLTQDFTTNSASDIERYFQTSIWLQEDLIGSAIASPTIADLDNDNDMEIIVQTSNSIIYILDHEGNFLQGWGENGIVGTSEELTSDLGLSPAPLALDLNGDDILEIICATYNPGTIQAWYLNTEEVPGWDIALDGKVTSSLVAGDIDGDGQKEIVVGTWGGTLYAFELNGLPVSGFPFTGATDSIIGTPALGNLDEDVALEIVFGSYDYYVYAVNGDGNILTGWPRNTNYLVRSSPAIIDLDNDAESEVIIGSWDKNLYIYHQNGSNFESWPWYSSNSIINSPTIGDLNQDGYFDFIIQPSNVSLYAFTDARNTKNPAWIYSQSDIIYEDAIIVDLDRDYYPEIIEVTRGGEVIILSHQGELILEEQLSNKGFDSAPAIGDIDADGFIEIIFTTHGQGTDHDYSDVFCYKLGSFGLLPWLGYRGGYERNGKPYDRDLDGLSDLEEQMLSTNITDNDTDNDGLTDGDEIYKYALNPKVNDITEDTDNDLLTNVVEIDSYNTNPMLADSDGDNLEDGYEVLTSGTNPNDPDTDHDLLPDDFEVQYNNPNPFVVDTFEDLDEDNLNNYEEYTHNTNPDLADTDGDLLLDGDEVKKYLTNPLVGDADLDSDGDELSNVDEIDIYKTNPILYDTDGDGYSDGEEVRRGSDPNDPNSTPFPLWALAPILGGILIILTFTGYFAFRKIYQKRRGDV